MLPIVTHCDDCCACCMHMGYPSFVRDPEEVHWATMPSDLKQELLDHIAGYEALPRDHLDGPCFWLDIESKRCKHHSHRPQVCRDFSIGGDDCVGWREVYFLGVD